MPFAGETYDKLSIQERQPMRKEKRMARSGVCPPVPLWVVTKVLTGLCVGVYTSPLGKRHRGGL